MALFISWCGFVGAWLLVAGPIYQAGVELHAHEIARERIESVKASITPPPRISAWWWLLPTVKVVFERRRAVAFNRAYVSALRAQRASANRSYAALEGTVKLLTPMHSLRSFALADPRKSPGSVAPSNRLVVGFLAALLLPSAGCLSFVLGNSAQTRFQTETGCGSSRVSDQGNGEFDVSGCGSTAHYTCVYGRTDDFAAKDSVCIRGGDLDLQGPPIAYAPASPPAQPAAQPASDSHRSTGFPLHTAIATMALAASFADECNTLPGPRGVGSAEVTFGTDGHVTQVTLAPPYANNPVGECVAGKFRHVVLRPFEGGAKKTRKAFTVPDAAPGAASAVPSAAR